MARAVRLAAEKEAQAVTHLEAALAILKPQTPPNQE